LTPYLYSLSEKDLAEKDFSKSVFAAEHPYRVEAD
jgi:hypothetical protein